MSLIRWSRDACVVAITAAVVLTGHRSARADVLTSFLLGNLASTVQFQGQSVTIPNPGQYSGISFHFFDASNQPLAVGTLYLFSSVYTGTPDDLASASYLAASVIAAGNEYVFDPAVLLDGGKQYFFFADAAFSARGSITDHYSGGARYSTPDGTTGFDGPARGDLNFVLSGTPVPEPAAAALLCVGLAGAAALRRRRVPVTAR